MNHKKRSWIIITTIFLTAILSICIYHMTSPSEIDILMNSIPNAIQFYEKNSSLLNSLICIQKKYEHDGEDGYWAVYRKSEDTLSVLGLPTTKWDSVILFSLAEREWIEAAFAISCNDISITTFNSRGEIRIKHLSRYYLKIMFLPDKESFHQWIENDQLVQYSEPISDGWYIILADARPFMA